MDGTDPTPPKGNQPWAWAAAVAGALIILVVGAIIGMTTSGGGSTSASGNATGTGALETTGPSIPPTVTVPEATGTGLTETTGAGGAPGTGTGSATETTGTTTGSAVAGFMTWPANKDGYTVVLDSVAQGKGQDAAVAKARKAKAAGLPQVGILLSSNYSTLKPGFWVVFSGVYDSLPQAASAVSQAAAAGFTGAYPRNIAS